MKKATLSIGLFTLIMVLTSFTTPETINTKYTLITPIDGSGSQMGGSTRKADARMDIDGSGSQMGGSTRKADARMDIDGSGSQMGGSTRKAD